MSIYIYLFTSIYIFLHKNTSSTDYFYDILDENKKHFPFCFNLTLMNEGYRMCVNSTKTFHLSSLFNGHSFKHKELFINSEQSIFYSALYMPKFLPQRKNSQLLNK